LRGGKGQVQNEEKKKARRNCRKRNKTHGEPGEGKWSCSKNPCPQAKAQNMSHRSTNPRRQRSKTEAQRLKKKKAPLGLCGGKKQGRNGRLERKEQHKREKKKLALGFCSGAKVRILAIEDWLGKRKEERKRLGKSNGQKPD